MVLVNTRGSFSWSWRDFFCGVVGACICNICESLILCGVGLCLWIVKLKRPHMIACRGVNGRFDVLGLSVCVVPFCNLRVILISLRSVRIFVEL